MVATVLSEIGYCNDSQMNGSLVRPLCDNSCGLEMCKETVMLAQNKREKDKKKDFPVLQQNSIYSIWTDSNHIYYSITDSQTAATVSYQRAAVKLSGCSRLSHEQPWSQAMNGAHPDWELQMNRYQLDSTLYETTLYIVVQYPTRAVNPRSQWPHPIQHQTMQ